MINESWCESMKTFKRIIISLLSLFAGRLVNELDIENLDKKFRFVLRDEGTQHNLIIYNICNPKPQPLYIIFLNDNLPKTYYDFLLKVKIDLSIYFERCQNGIKRR